MGGRGWILGYSWESLPQMSRKTIVPPHTHTQDKIKSLARERGEMT
jgi:hypothetical protein